MRSRASRISLGAIAMATFGGCAARPGPVAVVPPPPPVAVAAAVPMPAGAHPGMTTPPLLPDGTYTTPNRALSEAATMWHLRAGLNVAALACRGPDDLALIARYNAMLARQRGVLRDAEAQLAGQYRARGGTEWRAEYDVAMTSLYNFFSQSFARDEFCAASARILTESETLDSAAFPAFATARLPLLDAAFTNFYRRYDAWRTQKAERIWIELGPVAALPDPSGQEVIRSRKPIELAAIQPSR